MNYEARPYQIEMYRWLMDRDEAALWCTPGLGKTVVTLTAVADLILEGACKGVLIVAPIRVINITWPDQVEEWDHLRWLKVANLRTPEGKKAWLSGSADIYLINPELLPSQETTRNGETTRRKGFVEGFIKGKKIPVDTIVFDELSLAKGPSSKRFKSIGAFIHDLPDENGGFRYRSPFVRRWGLTGTPVENNYLDLWAQTKLLDNGKRLGRVFSHYKSTYFTSDYMGWSCKLNEGAKEKIDAKLADLALVMLGEDHLDLPPIHIEDVEVSLPAEVTKIYKTLEKEFLVQLDNGEIEALSAAALTTKLLQVTAGCVFDAGKETHVVHDAKIDALKALRKKHPKEPIMVFTAYTHERKRILEAFPEAREFNEKHLDEWKAGKISMWVADARSLSHGIDGLQKGGRIAVWTTPTYAWGTFHQANKRFHRSGQEKETRIYRILAKNTIDWAVVETLRAKEEGNAGAMKALKNLQKLRKN